MEIIKPCPVESVRTESRAIDCYVESRYKLSSLVNQPFAPHHRGFETGNIEYVAAHRFRPPVMNTHLFRSMTIVCSRFI